MMDDIVSSPASGLDLSPSIPVSKHLARRMHWVGDDVRSMGLLNLASRGTGKSRLLGRMLGFLDFVRRIPLVILDPHGPTIDTLLDKVTRLPAEEQRRLGQRILYVDMSGKSGGVVSLPLYYRLGNESHYEISQRPLDVFRKVDPWLVTASIEGYNALWEIGTMSGMVLSALNFQITEAAHLIRNPKAWSSRFTQAIKNDPEVRPAVEFFTQRWNQMSQSARDKHSRSYLRKIALFTLDPASRAMHGASVPGIDWHRVVSERLAVLLDFRHVKDMARRRFLMRWVFDSLVNFIKFRGAGRHVPISLIIDELSELLNWETLGVDTFSEDLSEAVHVLGRNYSWWISVATQELYVYEPRMQKTLLSMGTKIVGSTTDPDAALTLARQFHRYDPYKVKDYEPVWMNVQQVDEIDYFFNPRPPISVPQIVDYRPVYFTPEEQLILESYKFRDELGRFQFLVKPPAAEGDIRGELRQVTIENIDRGIYVNEPLVAEVRERLARQSGTPIDQLLPEINTRLEKKRRQIKRPQLPSLFADKQESKSGT